MKCLCPRPICSLYTGDRGRTPTRCWRSSLECEAFTSSTRRREKHLMMATPSLTLERHPALTRTRGLPRRTMEAPLPGHHGIDLHLGQKPKLWGEVYRHLTHLHIISCRHFVYPCCSFLSFFIFNCLPFIAAFQNTKRPKIFLLFLFICFFKFQY